MNHDPQWNERYSRHFLLRGFGQEGQIKLSKTSVCLVGAGGLASPVGMYLAAVGIGKIGIVDDDSVSLSNLQRQIIHGESQIGRPKTESAKKRLCEINSTLKVACHQTRLTPDNAKDILKDYDITVNCCDNFPTRYLINRVCVALQKPLVEGAVSEYTGQITVLATSRGGPCFSCLYPNMPSQDTLPKNPAILGTVPGIIGVLQATEVIKLATGIAEPLIGRLLIYDALGPCFKTVSVQPDPQCPICSQVQSPHKS